MPMVHAETRRLAAIMFTDMVGFSRQMGADEARTLRLLEVHNQLIQQAVSEHHGVVIKTVGDAFLVDFPSVVHAVQGAQQIQAQFRGYNAEKALAEQIHVRIGIHSGDIVQKDGDVLGDGVNIASRLQTLAEPDTICISDMVYRDVAKKVELGTVVSLGRPKLKNIADRFRVYALLPESAKGWRQTPQRQRLKLRGVGMQVFVLVSVVLLGGQQWISQFSHDPRTLAQALEAAQRAVTLHDSFWVAHGTLGLVSLYQQQYEQALAEMERAVALNPSVAGSYAGLAEVLSRMGRADEALRAAEQALRLKSFIVDGYLSSVGIVYALAGRYAEALAPLQRFLSRYPNILDARLTLAAVYSELGKEAEARAEAAEVLRPNPNFSLEVHKQRVPIRDPVVLERHIAALRQAGLK
jgi:class 3 adenylate cyclase